MSTLETCSTSENPTSKNIAFGDNGVDKPNGDSTFGSRVGPVHAKEYEHETVVVVVGLERL
jgi:hypothetical protein